ncbi:MAG: prepilin peptidase [Dehalococcoidia bacterium]|nr:prepilin peptidase [Dehalococcoidia bacterium]MCA9849304.1 prepilin peptidase [Dehalococcoidia bacterium]MCA9857118.1 prepilin peptidase [Dehalococcoidia bacterium]MCB9484134.1 prepilin peptidase [Dehalococcoidia bacterium]MCB9491186.1 prepilin peptidase [Dehalococcoidia bacterium]
MGALRIPSVMPAVVLFATAALGGAVGSMVGRDALAIAAIFSASTLIVASVAWDLHARRIPNTWTYPGLAVGLALAIAGGPSDGLSALAGALLAGVLFLSMSLVSRGGLGIGDVKLGAALGAFVGPVGAIDLVLVTAVAGGLLGVAWLIAGRGRRSALPYAPALAVGGWMALAALGPLAT